MDHISGIDLSWERERELHMKVSKITDLKKIITCSFKNISV